MTDFIWNFPTAGLALALEGLDALRADLGTEAALNALGDPRDAEGNIAPPFDGSNTPPAWVGRPGTAATSYDDPLAGKTIELPAKGDPGKYYMHLRTDRDTSAGFDPEAYGLAVTVPAESAAVLGIWAGDPAP